jgi:hypothetical protein
MMKRRAIALMSLLLAAACREGTGPHLVPGSVSWIEWPTAVTVSQPGSIRASGYAECPYDLVFGVSLTGTALRVTADGRQRSNTLCPLLSGSGAGYDTLLPLPRLGEGVSQLPYRYSIWAPVAVFGGVERPNERMVGTIELRAVPDTATMFAGVVRLFLDSLRCWRAMPYSAHPMPRWSFAKPLLLDTVVAGRNAFLSGLLVQVSPPVCGDSQAIDPLALEVDIAPSPFAIQLLH